MGKGDKRTRRGKIYNGSHGKRRPGKPKKTESGGQGATPPLRPGRGRLLIGSDGGSTRGGGSGEDRGAVEELATAENVHVQLPGRRPGVEGVGIVRGVCEPE